MPRSYELGIFSLKDGDLRAADEGSIGEHLLPSLPYLVGHLGFPQRLELMERFGVDHMYAMPSALNGLAQLCEEEGRPARERFPGLRSIVISGEGWPVDLVGV